ncbi:MAG: pssF [Ramlibacter sp.]|nr:pssF [Ramlibacter sp.]
MRSANPSTPAGMSVHRYPLDKKPGHAAGGLSEEVSERGSQDCRAKLAVIISCYNYEDFVGRTIRSVLDQERRDCQVVVVDDGSTDRSWEIISQHEVNAFRIKNSGQLAACLYGLDHTDAPFILFLDADDALKPGALETIIGQLDDRVAKLQFSLTLIDGGGTETGGAFSILESFRSRHNLIRRVLASGVYLTPPTSGNVFRRDVCELLREVDYDRAVDGVILFAAPFFGDIVSLSEELGYYRIHGRNDSGLGRLPDAESLQRDVTRFVKRTQHLSSIVRRMYPGHELVDPEDTFYYRERMLYVDVASGRRPAIRALPKLLAKLLAEPFSVASKLALATFFLLCSVLPNDRAMSLLAYRLKGGSRSLLGFAKQISVRARSEP